MILSLLLTWLVPGSGHLLLGRGGKGALYFSLLTFTYLVGLLLADFRCVNAENFGLHLIAEIFYGGATLLALALTADLGLTHAIPFLDAGVLFCAVAGLLNVCVMVDVFETAFPRPAGAPAGERTR